MHPCFSLITLDYTAIRCAGRAVPALEKEMGHYFGDLAVDSFELQAISLQNIDACKHASPQIFSGMQ